MAYGVADLAEKLSGAAARLDHEKNRAMELWACRDLTPQEKAAAHLLAVISNHRAISWWRAPDTPDGTDPLPALESWQEEQLRKATINAAHAYAAFLPERQAAALVTLVPEPALKKPHKHYFGAMHSRLASRTLWAGGMLADTDLVTLEDAARFASKHAGTEITPNDFLRAAGRGQIPLRAIVHCRAKVQRFDGGIFCNAGQADENIVPAGAIPTLPLTACQHLAAAGRASWRTFDGFENMDGELMRFTKGMLTDDEPDFETVPSDCRLMGNDVHALADAFIEEPEPQPAPPAPVVADSASNASVWAVQKPKRYAGYTAPLYRLLSEINCTGRPVPTARDVVEAWRITPPAEIAQVLVDGFDYYDSRGETKAASLDAIRKAIERMTDAR